MKWRTKLEICVFLVTLLYLINDSDIWDSIC